MCCSPALAARSRRQEQLPQPWFIPAWELGRGEPCPGRPCQHTHSFFSSWRLWDPPAAGQGASLRRRVQSQGEGPRGGRAWGGEPWALLGQDCCRSVGRKHWGHLCSMRSCQHTVPLKILALGGRFLLSTQGRCLVLQHHLGGSSVPGATQYCFWGDHVLGLSRKGCRHLPLCFIFLHVDISHRKAKAT